MSRSIQKEPEEKVDDESVVDTTMATNSTIEQSAPAAAVVAVATSADPSQPSNDESLAMQLYVIEQLTTIFQFPKDLSIKAVECVGADVVAASNWILDEGGEDKGGTIIPISDCPHIQDHFKVKAENIQNIHNPCLGEENGHGHNHKSVESNNKKGGKLKEDLTETGSCPSGENWLCLHCNAIRCSRYINGHAKVHWENKGHCIAVSLEDFSIWCYECNAYLHHEKFQPILDRLSDLKFGGDEEDEDFYG